MSWHVACDVLCIPLAAASASGRSEGQCCSQNKQRAGDSVLGTACWGQGGLNPCGAHPKGVEVEPPSVRELSPLRACVSWSQQPGADPKPGL